MSHTITVIDDEIVVTETTVHGDASHDATVASLSGGKVPTAELGAGVAGVTTFLRGDQSWAIPAGGGGGGAPTDATYITATANATLTGEALLSAVIGKGTLAARPAFGTAGRLYYVTDSGSERWTRDTGSAWEDVASSMNQLVAPTAAVSLNSQKITGLGTPTADTDAATKGYADAIVQGLDWKGSVRAATTANITLSGAQTIDGISIVATDRVLVKNQTTGSQNGIYVAASGAWARSTDADGSGGSEVNAGMATFIESGTAAADTGWVLTTNNPITLGTTSLVFTQFSGAGSGISVAIVDAKGDLIVGTAADTVARFAAGTNGFLLSANSATASGLEWVVAPSGGGGITTHPYRLVNDTAATLVTGDREGVVAVKCTAANRVATLPLADSHDGYRMTIILTGDSTVARKIVLTPQAGDFIHYGSVGATMDIDQPGAGVTVQAVASEDRWLVVSEVP